MSLHRVPFATVASRAFQSGSLLILSSIAALPGVAQNQAWIRQVGTNANEGATAAATDGSGGVYVSGNTLGSLGGPSAGSNDAWLARHDAAGSPLWIRQLGTSNEDFAHAAATDGSGGAYVCGRTRGRLGAISAGGFDAWLAHYDPGGGQLWIRQLGTHEDDGARAAATDSAGGLYVGGTTDGNLGGANSGGIDAWLARFDSAGIQLWIRQLGTNIDDPAFAMAPDGSSGVYVAGHTYGSLAKPNAGHADAWLAHYDGTGIELWVRQLGTNTLDWAFAAASDGAGGVYLAGPTVGALGSPSKGKMDAWIARYDAAGNNLWIRQFGTDDDEMILAATEDGLGGVFTAGWTTGSLGGSHVCGFDAWLAHHAGDGSQAWITQPATCGDDTAAAAAPAVPGAVHVGGATTGILGASNLGAADAWLARYDGSCGAGTKFCAAKYTSGGCLPLASWSGQPSASAGAGFVVLASGIPNNHVGAFLYGTAGQQLVPFQGGWLCVKPPLMRTPLQTTGVGFLCSGTFSLDFNAYIASGKDPQLAAGIAVDGQFWIRNPSVPNITSFTDGLHFVICP